MSYDIDGRVYRRFSYLRNRLLLDIQDKLNQLEQQLDDLDHEDEEKAKAGEKEGLYRLISRRYNEKHGTATTATIGTQTGSNQNVGQVTTPLPSPPLQPAASQTTIVRQPDQTNAIKRVELLKAIEENLAKYDEVLLREHEICSIRHSTSRQRSSLANFIWNGKDIGLGKPQKPLEKKENKAIYRRDDSILLGTQDDAWLGTAAESLKRLMPGIMRRVSLHKHSEMLLTASEYLLANKEDRERSRQSKTEYLTNDRINSFVKSIVSIASTILLVLPIIILYALSTHGASGWLKIGILLMFVVAFALALSVLTNASRSEMFGASAG
jgi:hypothetical protein